MTPTTRVASAAGPEANEVDRLADAVLGTAGVASLAGGGPLLPVTYLPGRRVIGIRTSAERVEVAVVADFGVRVTELAARIRTSVAMQAQGRPVNVHVADVQLPVPSDAGAPPAGGHTDPA